MSRVTVCPHFLCGYNLNDPKLIEREFIAPLVDFLDKAHYNNIQIFFYNKVLDHVIHTYPWDKMSDPSWKGYLIDWNTLIQQKILKRCCIVNSAIQINSNYCCPFLLSPIDSLFHQFLGWFLTKNMPGNDSEEGVFSGAQCKDHYFSLGCYALNDPHKLNFIKYPWLRIYDHNLPTGGEYFFVPPLDWRSSSCQRKGTAYGYLDSRGVEWVWDKLHKDHWDVQDGSPYKNVSPDGSILS